MGKETSKAPVADLDLGGEGKPRQKDDFKFNWDSGHYEMETKYRAWGILGFQMITSLLLAFGAVFVNSALWRPYSIFEQVNDIEKLHGPVEALRWITFFALGWFFYVLTNVATFSLIPLLCMLFKNSKGEVSKTVITIGNNMLALRQNSSIVISAALMMVISQKLLFVLPAVAELVKEAVETEVKGGKAAQAKVKMTAAAMQELIDKKFREMQGGGFFLQKIHQICRVFAIFSLARLLEMVIVRSVATKFHYTSFGRRIEETRDAIGKTRAIADIIIKNDPGLTNEELSTIVFRGLCTKDRTTISMSDFELYMPTEEAVTYFAMIDREGLENLTEDQFAKAYADLIADRQKMNAAMTAQDGIMDNFQTICTLFLIIILSSFSTVLIGIDVMAFISGIGTLSTIIVFIFKQPLKEAYRSMVFIVFVHPFDIGDTVTIDGTEYDVLMMGMLTTAFIGPNNRVTYISNSQLDSTSITNTRRSPPQSEMVIIHVLASTSVASIKALESDLKAFLSERPRDYKPSLMISDFTITDQNDMKLSMCLTHRSNFQEWSKKVVRTRNFMLFLKEALKRHNISLALPRECPVAQPK